MYKKKNKRMTHEIVLTTGSKESLLALTKSEGLAKQLQRTLDQQFECEVIIRPLKMD
jgi:arginine repressor